MADKVKNHIMLFAALLDAILDGQITHRNELRNQLNHFKTYE